MKGPLLLFLLGASFTAEPPAQGTMLIDGIPTEEILSLAIPFLACILILAGIESWTRKLRRVLKKRQENPRRPGCSPLRPLSVTRFSEVSYLSQKKCHCGASPKVVYEGATSSQQRKLWLVIQVCPACQTRDQTYFDITGAKGGQPVSTSPATPSPH